MIANRPGVEAAVRAAIAHSMQSTSKCATHLTRGAWATACVAALGLGFGTAASAQTKPADQSSDAGGGKIAAPLLEEITVTGTRIKRTTDFETPTPTTVIDTTAMESLGIVNIGETLTVTPANISTFTPAATGNANFFTGSYIADLRGLNPYFGSRTLTLVNTRRMVQTDQGDSVDLNFIPQILVERVDTVTGGASAAYGSGAIAGVVNVILQNKLEGGKLNVDWFQTGHNDAKDRHVGAAYGHGLFDNKVHFVLGGEYEKQDPVPCASARSWCASNEGFYQGPTTWTNPQTGQTVTAAPGVTPLIAAPNLTRNQVNANGVFFNGSGASTTLQATPSGTGTSVFNIGTQPYAGDSARNIVPGGDGTPLYSGGNGTGISSLMAPVDRRVFSGTLTASLTDTIRFSTDVNWGRVETTDLNGAGIDAQDGISKDNAFIQGNPALIAAVGPGASVSKYWASQVDGFTRFTTTVKRFSAGFDGDFGQSSWSWDTYYAYGLTNREQLVQNTTHLYEEYMALDSVMVNGQPQCRVTAAGGVGAAIAQSLAAGDGFPTYGLAPASQWAALAQGCVPLNPFGTQALSPSAIGYSFGNLDERLRYSQSVAALNTSGNIFRGVGAGPFSAAVGFEWRQEVGHNDEVPCAVGDAHCQAARTDFLVQYGQPFGGAVTVQEGYLETSLPLAKDLPFAKQLVIDLAARESHYDNKALYGINVVNGVQPEFKHNLTTWKASLNYMPTDWFRFRGSQSRDARAANFRELYYGQIIQSGGIFGYCNPGGIGGGGKNGVLLDPCQWNLEGNVNVRPETSDTTTLGFVLTPTEVLPGFQFSADWFHIKITDAIEQASVQHDESLCRAGDGQACSQMVFNNNLYDATGLPCAVAGDGANCTGAPTYTGAAAWQHGANNATQITSLSYNGAFYEVKGVDFSLNYAKDIGSWGSINTRFLMTWMDEQQFAQCTSRPGVPCYTFNILGQTGSGNTFLNDYQPDAKWRGNLMVTWTKGGLSLTPNVTFVSAGIMDYLGVTPQNPALYQAALTNPNLLAPGVDLHPLSDNHVPSYILTNFNATYRFQDMGVLKGLQLFLQVNNVFDKVPPFAGGGGAFGPSNSYGGTNPIFFDTLGRAWRLGFRTNF